MSGMLCGHSDTQSGLCALTLAFVVTSAEDAEAEFEVVDNDDNAMRSYPDGRRYPARCASSCCLAFHTCEPCAHQIAN